MSLGPVSLTKQEMIPTLCMSGLVRLQGGGPEPRLNCDSDLSAPSSGVLWTWRSRSAWVTLLLMMGSFGNGFLSVFVCNQGHVSNNRPSFSLPSSLYLSPCLHSSGRDPRSVPLPRKRIRWLTVQTAAAIAMTPDNMSSPLSQDGVRGLQSPF